MLTTGQMIDKLKVGQKAIVMNHIGYKSHLVRVLATEEECGGFEWRYTYPNGTKHKDYFSLDDDTLKLKWIIKD